MLRQKASSSKRKLYRFIRTKISNLRIDQTYHHLILVLDVLNSYLPNFHFFLFVQLAMIKHFDDKGFVRLRLPHLALFNRLRFVDIIQALRPPRLRSLHFFIVQPIVDVFLKAIR